MKEKKTAVLNTKQQKQIQQLIAQCERYEPISLRPALTAAENFDPTLPCFFLLSDGDMLLSFLALFLPREDYGEAIAFTHPAARGRGYFSRLWDMALTVLDDAGVLEDMELLLVTDRKSPDAQKTLEALDGEYQYGEYFLEKKLISSAENAAPQAAPTSEATSGLTLSAPVSDDEEMRALLTDLHELIFCEGQKASTAFIAAMLTDENSDTFCLTQDGTPIGLFHLTQTGDKCYLSGFGIHPDRQGKGFGKTMLALAETQAAKLSPALFLQVGDYNEAAFGLYTKNGYEETYHLEYYY